MKALTLNLTLCSDSLARNKSAVKQAKYLAIADALRQAIKEGQVTPTEVLPSARKLAQQLSVNRHTIMAALAELVAQGWVEAKERSAYRVVKNLPIQASRQVNKVRQTQQSFDWKFRFKQDLPVTAKVKASQYSYNFSGGQPDIRQFPFLEFKSHFSQVCQRPKIDDLSYGDSRGETELIEEIATYLRRVRSITDKELMICNGSQEALYMISQLLLQPGDKVAVEQLGYPPAWAAFERSGASLIAIKQDDRGLDPEHLAQVFAQGKVKLLYLTPLHQYPTTVSLDITRRMQIYQLAVQYGVAIVEDDYDHEFHYDSQPIAPMASDDPAGLVIYISTFSKLMFGGARIGYVVANDELIEQLAAYKVLMNHKSNVLVQQSVAKWMQQGGFEGHLRRMTRLYQKRRDFMVLLLQDYQSQGLPIHFEIPAGGMAIWLDTGKSVVGLKEKLMSNGVYIQTEVEFNMIKRLPNTEYRFIRLGFAAMNELEVEQGLNIVMKALYGVLSD
ncbi:PLP-dependent aminotransferase family protein [Colwellia psychrerythraea]|uniref:Transcriptional regulator, GntR family with aminotransferase domain containing protein n=1 Tax=Colwellia psychrerythraea TaxID=28229 RepID=A0A099KFQ3_COLPS|nr:PLP-dependent aminotransferase family protein [Colwellia psychrerythraea]KGJ89171.1 transcriptional regulator, GntR family with aminotransferase domain containing protein [Colwellia psychrerythraea]